MKRTSIRFSVLLASGLMLLGVVPGVAQDRPGATSAPFSESISPGEMAPTPEMWFYQQYRSDYADPKMAVRKKAEFRAEQRQRRMAALKWFGFSNQRPNCSSDPFHGDWSPSWKSNNSFYPSRWQGTGPSWVVVRPDPFGTWVR